MNEIVSVFYELVMQRIEQPLIHALGVTYGGKLLLDFLELQTQLVVPVLGPRSGDLIDFVR